jgi:hypothetical protein
LSFVLSRLRRSMRVSAGCHSRFETTQPRIWWCANVPPSRYELRADYDCRKGLRE